MASLEDKKKWCRTANENFKNIRIRADDYNILRELSAESLVSMTKILHRVMPIAEREFGGRGARNEED